MKFFKKLSKKDEKEVTNSREAAKERLHLVLMQDRANVSADSLELMKQEIIDVIKKYIDIDEGAIDVRLTNKENEDGTNGAPALYANIPIVNIKNEARKVEEKIVEVEEKKDDPEKEEMVKEKEEQKEKEIEDKDKEKEEKKKDKKEEEAEIIIDDGQNDKEEEKEEQTEDAKEKFKSEN